MNRALVIKELRECAPLAALAALLAAWALMDVTGNIWHEVGRGVSRVPFVENENHYADLVIIAGGLALLLGFKQTVWEDFRGTYHYLLHRPVDRRRVF